MQYHYGQFTPDHLFKIKEGVELFNEQKYWECHEVLEDLWMEDRMDAARNVYWAIIQVAAACIHYRDGKITGALGMVKKAKEKFRRCHEQHVLTPIVLKYLDWEELETLVMSIKEQDAMLSDFEALFNFRFTHYTPNPT